MLTQEVMVGREQPPPQREHPPALAGDAARDNVERLFALLLGTASILEQVELYCQLGRF